MANRGFESIRMVLATTLIDKQICGYVVFIRLSKFQTFLHNADCQLKHYFWLTLCSVKNAVVGCQPVSFMIGVSLYTICIRFSLNTAAKRRTKPESLPASSIRFDAIAGGPCLSTLSAYLSKRSRLVSTKSPALSLQKYTPLASPCPSKLTS